MDKRDFTVISNETEKEEKILEKEYKSSAVTNPISRKFAEFQSEKKGKFSVKDLFKK